MFSFDPVTNARSVSLSWQPLSCSTKNLVRVLDYMLELFTDGIEGNHGIFAAGGMNLNIAVEMTDVRLPSSRSNLV